MNKEVILGVDFGTSGIKCGYWDGLSQYAVLIPIGMDEDIFVYKHSTNETDNIKIQILEQYSDASDSEKQKLKQIAIEKLTDALKEAKKHLDKNKITNFEEYRFSISSDNIKYDDNKKEFWHEIFIQALEKAGFVTKVPLSIHEEIKCVLTTFYLEFKQGIKPMHWIADMGHGTLDIICFTATRENDKIKPNVLISSVENNGMMFKDKDNFRKKIKNQFFEIQHELKKYRNPGSIHFEHESYKKTKMPLIITGGGAEKCNDMFTNIFEDERCIKISNFEPFLMNKIEFDTNSKDYIKSRFTVLYGLLSYEIEDIAELKPPFKISNISLKKLDIKEIEYA